MSAIKTSMRAQITQKYKTNVTLNPGPGQKGTGFMKSQHRRSDQMCAKASQLIQDIIE